MAKAKKDDLFSCGLCGLVVAVDTACGCEAKGIICCKKIMVKGAAAAAKARKLTTAAAKKPAPVKVEAKKAPLPVKTLPAKKEESKAVPAAKATAKTGSNVAAKAVPVKATKK